MARVTIDETVWEKIHEIKDRLGWSKREVTGLLVTLWHKTQKDELHVISTEELVDYAALWDEDEKSLQKIIKALVWQKILTQEGEDSYRINGNNDHIEKLKNYRKNGSKGGRPKKTTSSDSDSDTFADSEEEVNAYASQCDEENQTETEQGNLVEVKNQAKTKNNLKVLVSKPNQNQKESLGLPIQYNSNQNNSPHFNSKSGDPPQRKIKFNEIIDLWNSLAPPGKRYSALTLSGKAGKYLLESIEHPNLNRIESWRKLFTNAFAHNWLCSQGPLSLGWILQEHNALECLTGQFSQNPDSSDKSNTEENIDWSFIQEDPDAP